MGEIIYWKPLDEPQKFYCPILKREEHQLGEWVVNDERAQIFSIVGALSATDVSKMNINGALVMKNGERKDFKGDLNKEDAVEDIVSQAEEFLKSLPK